MRQSDTSVSGDRFIEPSRTARRLLTAWVSLGVIVFAMSRWLLSQSIPEANATIAEMNKISERLLVANWVALGITVCMAMVWTFYFGRIGFRALATGEYPPPGTMVVRRTIVKVGLYARISAVLSIVMAVLVWFPVAMQVYVLCFLEHAA